MTTRRELGASSCDAIVLRQQWQAQTARWEFRCCSGGVKPSRRPRMSPVARPSISPPPARIDKIFARKMQRDEPSNSSSVQAVVWDRRRVNANYLREIQGQFVVDASGAAAEDG